MNFIRNNLGLLIAFLFLFVTNLISFVYYYVDYRRYHYGENIKLYHANGVFYEKIDGYQSEFDGAIYLKINNSSYLELWCDNVKKTLYAPDKSNSRRKKVGDCHKVLNVSKLNNTHVSISFDTETNMLYQLERDGEIVVSQDYMLSYYKRGFNNKISFRLLVLSIIFISFLLYMFFPSNNSRNA